MSTEMGGDGAKQSEVSPEVEEDRRERSAPSTSDCDQKAQSERTSGRQ